MYTRQELGRRGENIASKYLKKNNYIRECVSSLDLKTSFTFFLLR